MNPLLDTGDLPAFDRIDPGHVVPAVEHTLKTIREQIEQLLESGGPYRWDNLLAPLEAAQERLHQVWSPVSHLNAVRNSPDMREAYTTCLAQLSAFETELGQHEGLYRAVRSVADSEQFSELDTARQKSIENRLRDFRLSGITLESAQRERFKTIQQRLSALQAKFQDNVLDATGAWKKHVTDEALLSGLPETAKAQARQSAERENIEGWRLTLEFPAYFPVITYADGQRVQRSGRFGESTLNDFAIFETAERLFRAAYQRRVQLKSLSPRL
ncbi:MAG: hypothetical protein ACWGNB_07310, partial [Thiogranum sp.]